MKKKKISGEEFSKNMLYYMATKNMSAGQVRKLTGINAPTFSNYVSGTRVPRLENLNLLARALGISVDDLTKVSVTEAKEYDLDTSVYLDKLQSQVNTIVDKTYRLKDVKLRRAILEEYSKLISTFTEFVDKSLYYEIFDDAGTSAVRKIMSGEFDLTTEETQALNESNSIDSTVLKLTRDVSQLRQNIAYNVYK